MSERCWLLVGLVLSMSQAATLIFVLYVFFLRGIPGLGISL